MKACGSLIILNIILFIDFPIFGQQSFGIKVNGGFSSLVTKVNSPTINQTFYFMPSGQGGVFYNMHLSPKSLFGAELLFMQIEGRGHSSSPETDNNGNQTGQYIIGDARQHISYLSIPIYYGYNFKKISINLGLQANFALASSGQEKTQTPYNGNVLVFEDNVRELPIKDYDFGARTGMSYLLAKKISMEATYYYGLTNIYKYNSIDTKWRIQQITVGLRYTFLTIQKKGIKE